MSAAVSASVIFKVAAERAARGSAGLGSFAVAFLDALSRLGLDEG